jgi:hypothetical protein
VVQLWDYQQEMRDVVRFAQCRWFRSCGMDLFTSNFL